MNNTLLARIRGIALFSSSPHSAGAAFIAMVLELGVGLVVSAIVFMVFAPTAASLTDHGEQRVLRRANDASEGSAP